MDTVTVLMWTWWSLMVMINITNLVVAFIIFRQSRGIKQGKYVKYRKWMLLMGSIFTIVGLYRSIFVSEYGPQHAWFNTIANSSFVIRFLAMFAEMSFSGLIALAMLQFNKTIIPEEKRGSNKFILFMATNVNGQKQIQG